MHAFPGDRVFFIKTLQKPQIETKKPACRVAAASLHLYEGAANLALPAVHAGGARQARRRACKSSRLGYWGLYLCLVLGVSSAWCVSILHACPSPIGLAALLWLIVPNVWGCCPVSG